MPAPRAAAARKPRWAARPRRPCPRQAPTPCALRWPGWRQRARPLAARDVPRPRPPGEWRCVPARPAVVAAAARAAAAAAAATATCPRLAAMPPAATRCLRCKRNYCRRHPRRSPRAVGSRCRRRALPQMLSRIPRSRGLATRTLHRPGSHCCCHRRGTPRRRRRCCLCYCSRRRALPASRPSTRAGPPRARPSAAAAAEAPARGAGCAAGPTPLAPAAAAQATCATPAAAPAALPSDCCRCCGPPAAAPAVPAEPAALPAALPVPPGYPVPDLMLPAVVSAASMNGTGWLPRARRGQAALLQQ